jgi:hypothetical protein
MNPYRNNYLYLTTVFAAALTLGGCHSTPSATNDQSQPAADSTDQAKAGDHAGKKHEGEKKGEGRERAAAPKTVELPVGTEIRVRLDQDLSSKDSQAGDSFKATVADDVVVNGETVIPKDASAEGTVVDAKALGHFKGGALLAVKLDKVHTSFGSYPVDTASISKAEQGKGKRSALFIGGGAGLGALIGGLAGGGKGAAIGAAAGAGAGTGGAAFTGNKQIVLPAETLLTFKLDQPVRIVESRRDAGGDPALTPR